MSLTGFIGWIGDPDIEPQRLDHLQDLSNLTRRLSLLEFADEPQTRTAGHRQILLGDFQGFPFCADRRTNLFRSLYIHITDR